MNELSFSEWIRPHGPSVDQQSTAMTDPLDKATSKAPPTLGEGCLSRYDPEALSPEDGTDFEGAARLWEQLNPEIPDEQASRSLDPE